MSTAEAAAIVAAVLLFSLAATYWQIRRAMRHESRRDQFMHEQAEAAREVDDLELLYSMPAYDPAWEPGMERLWDAIRDEQAQRGD